MLKTYEAWKKIRLKHISNNIGQYGANLSTGNYLENGVRFLRTTDIQDNGELIESELGAYVDKSLVQDYLLESGDILFSRSGTLGRSYLHTNQVTGDFAFAGYLVRFKLNYLVYPKFIFYASKNSEFLAQIEADAIQTTISNFNGEKYGNIKILIPPLETQEAIAHFLDRKTATIDTLIAKKQRLIRLLEEKRTALINQAVTKGLNAIAPMKDSGIPWIREIPKHWKSLKLKHISKIYRGKFTHRPRNEPKLYGGLYPFLQTGDIARAGKFIENYSQTLNELGKEVSECFPSQTIVMSIAANIGDIAITSFDAYFPDSVIGFKPKPLLYSDFLYYLLLSMKLAFDREATENTQKNLNIERVGNIDVPLPPLNEQDRIVKHLEDTLGRQNDTKKLLKQQIEKLQEYRRSLITAAVTGKLDITQEKTP